MESVPVEAEVCEENTTMESQRGGSSLEEETQQEAQELICRRRNHGNGSDALTDQKRLTSRTSRLHLLLFIISLLTRLLMEEPRRRFMREPDQIRRSETAGRFW